MKLFLDTSDREKVRISLDGESFETVAYQKTSQKLLPFIDRTLKKKKVKLTDLTEIEFNSGPGSFTGLRVGAAVASTLSWTLNIPVNGARVLKKPIEIKY